MPLFPRPAWNDDAELRAHLDRATRSLDREEGAHSPQLSRWLTLGLALGMTLAVQTGCSLPSPVAVYGGPPSPDKTVSSPQPTPQQPVPPYGRPPQEPVQGGPPPPPTPTARESSPLGEHPPQPPPTGPAPVYGGPPPSYPPSPPAQNPTPLPPAPQNP